MNSETPENLFSPLMEDRPPAVLGFAHGALDRSAQMRARPDLIEALFDANEARVYAFCGDNAVLRRVEGGLSPLFRVSDLPATGHHQERVFLGRDGEAARFVVDSWFVDNGQPAVILPLAEWKKGAGPDV